MADEPIKEQKYSCGCHVVNGVLVAECTQSRPSGDLSAERHAVAKPFSPKCFRLAAEQQAQTAVAKAKADADLKTAKDEEKAAEVQP
jgi:hypothetical protein